MPGDSLAFKEAAGKTENLDILGIDPYWRPDDSLSQKAYIEQHTGEAVRIDGEVLDVLRLSLYQLMELERVPAHAAVSGSNVPDVGAPWLDDEDVALGMR